ncbi:histone deacetylase [Sphingomonas sp. MMS24-J45]|uniref:histone deacetylase family protein n=1 Tax=Sphingomonas sp. MMS24-J45 TaxID=3238806 RepID=UPI003851355A
MIAVVHHPAYVAAGQSANPSQLSKNAAIRDLLRGHDAAIAWHEPDAMPLHWIEAVHDPDYVAEVIAARVPREKERRIGFAVTPQVAARAQVVPGGTWLAGKLALERGFAANSAGGSHHALAATGAGYCVLNDLAIAAVRLVEEGDAARVLIVDCDVHQGDGTAALTAGRPGIATYSIHAEKNFPARKARSTLDVSLPDGTGDAAYLETLGATLLPMLDDYRPDLILYQAGIDPLADDRLGRLALTDAGLVARETFVAENAAKRGIALASTVGGGYGSDVMTLAAAHVRAILTLGQVYCGFPGRLREGPGEGMSR